MGGVNKWGELIEALGKASGPGRLPLPEIPDGYVRLTHVMPERSRQILSSGEPFIYRKHGLTGTTDSYSDNAPIEWLAHTGDPLGIPKDGMPSNWSRNDFGDHMALMDLPADAHKRIAMNYVGYDDPIPNQAILGFVDRKSMAFEPNSRYDRAVIEDYGRKSIDKILQAIERQNSRFSHRPNAQYLDIPEPLPNFAIKPDNDIW